MPNIMVMIFGFVIGLALVAAYDILKEWEHDLDIYKIDLKHKNGIPLSRVDVIRKGLDELYGAKYDRMDRENAKAFRMS